MAAKGLYFKELLKILSSMEGLRWKYAAAMFLSCLNYAAFKILFGFLNKDLINSVVKNDQELLIRAFIIAIVCVVISCIFYPVVMYVSGKSARQYMCNIRKKAVGHLFTIPAARIHSVHQGDWMSRLTTDLNTIEVALGDQMWNFLKDVLFGVGSCIIMFWLDWRLSIAVIILGLISALINTRYSKTIKVLSDKIQQTIGLLTQHLINMVEGARTQRMYGLNEAVTEKFTACSENVAGLYIRRNRFHSKIDGINFVLSTFNILGILGLGILMFIAGYIDLGTIIAIITLQNGVTIMFLQTGVFLAQLQASLAGAQRFFEFLEEAGERDQPVLDHGTNPGSRPGDMIVFHNVGFGYQENVTFLEQINIAVPKGKVAALVGLSGSGKTTVIKLILKLYHRQTGDIFIDGRNIDSFRLDELRRMISYVPQDLFLFSNTIEENIRYGKPDATQDEIINAAKAAYAHDFIVELPNGYQTQAGEKGVFLSGGQKQRIAIARAILNDSPILLLDEATSALDSESEFLIQKAINNVIRNKTVLIVAHRLSTIENADIIYVLDNGRVIEKGSHHELLHRRELYYKMYTTGFNKSGHIEGLGVAGQ